MAEEIEAFARARIDGDGQLFDFTFGGVELSVPSLDEARTYVRRHAMTVAAETVLTISDGSEQRSWVYNALGEATPYFGPVPEREDDGDGLDFAEVFDDPSPAPARPPVPPPAPEADQEPPTQQIEATGPYIRPEDRVNEEFSHPVRQAEPILADDSLMQRSSAGFIPPSVAGATGAGPGPDRGRKPKRAKKPKKRPGTTRPPESPRPQSAPQAEAVFDGGDDDEEFGYGTAAPTRSRTSGRTASIIAAAVAGVILLGGSVGVATGMVPNPLASPEETQTPEADPTLLTMGEASENPGFIAEAPDFTLDVPSTAAVTASDRGIVVVDGQDVTIYDSTSGKEVYSGEADGEVRFTLETTIGGEPALVWRYDDTLMVHRSSAFADPAVVEIPEGASVSSAGQQLLITDEEDRAYTLTDDGLDGLTVPGNAGTVMAVDAEGSVTAGFNTPVSVLAPDGSVVSKTELTPPTPALQMSRWLSAGHGLAVVVWSSSPSESSASQQVVIATHSLTDGSVAGKVTATQGELAEWKWMRGQGLSRAVLGPYAFDLTTGELVADATGISGLLLRPTGDTLTGTTDSGGFAVEGTTAHPSDFEPLAVVDDGSLALVRSDQTTIAAYPAEPKEAS